MKHDELKDMGHFLPMKKEFYQELNCKQAPLSDDYLFQDGNLKPIKPTTQNQADQQEKDNELSQKKNPISKD